MKPVTVFPMISMVVVAMVVFTPATGRAGSFRIGGQPLKLGGFAGPPGVLTAVPVGNGQTVTKTTVIITNPDARPMDHLPFLHPFARPVDVPRAAVVIETTTSVSASNGGGTQATGQWVWQTGQWVWRQQGWAWWPGQWVWTK